jgi:two-component system, OmpR family, response regulator TrcR
MLSAPRILLVNDDHDELFLLERTIAREFPAGVVWKSHSAEDALAFLAQQAVDAVITDNRMPLLGGLEMVRMIRAGDQRTPILMLTGSDEIKTAAFAAGVTAFLASGSWEAIRRQIRDLIKHGVTDQATGRQ